MVSIGLIKNYENSITSYYMKDAKLPPPPPPCISVKLGVMDQVVTVFPGDSWHLENYQHVQTIFSVRIFKSIKRDITWKMQI